MNLFVIICSFKPISVPALRWGNDNEQKARAAYEAKMNVLVTKTGLTLHNKYPYIGATADGMINDSVVLEIKCPYSGRHLTVHQLVETGYKHLQYDGDNSLQLKTTSPYYCQVQGEMALKHV